MSDFIAIPAIVVICWFIGMSIKQLGTSETADRFIPTVCGLIGGILGIVCFFVYPNMIPADDVLSAIATGIVSGLSATGINEAVKQLKK